MLKTLTLAAALALPFGAPLLAHDAAATAPASAEAPANALSIADGFTRATRPGAPVAGGFMLITNTTSHDDRLVGASSSVAGVMQVHEMAMEDGIMKMRELAGAADPSRRGGHAEARRLPRDVHGAEGAARPGDEG